MRSRVRRCEWIVILLAFLCVPTFARASAVDAYGCYGQKATRICTTGLLVGQTFSSLTAELKAYIAAQNTKITELTAHVTALNAQVNDLTAQLAACHATCPPAPPTTGTVTLTWRANLEPDVAGYNVYCGTASRVYSMIVPLGKLVTYRWDNLASGTYFCAVTAYDSSQNESGFSAEVSKVIP